MSFSDYHDGTSYDIVETHVCCDCVIDQELSQLVCRNLESNKCSYCGRTSKELIAAPFEILIERIYSSILNYYADAQDIGISYDKGWVFPETELWEVVGEFDPGWEEKFLNDIYDCIGYDKYFVPHTKGDWGLSNPADTLRFGWDRFTSTILYKTRFLFLNEPEDEHETGRPDYIPVASMLDAIGGLVKSLDLIKTIPISEMAYRVRVIKNSTVHGEFRDVSVPPRDISSAGRMNPAGIPLLYVALDPETAKKETLYNDKARYSLATMSFVKELRVIDLSELPDPPSVFEIDKYDQLHEIRFLRALQADISKRITKDGREHIDYVPTQVVSEYFRSKFMLEDGNRVDGVLFSSSKIENGKNLALFCSTHEEVETCLKLDGIRLHTP